MNMYSQLRRVGVMACKGHQIFYGEGQKAASTGLKISYDFIYQQNKYAIF
jgi:hypothetical protein